MTQQQQMDLLQVPESPAPPRRHGGGLWDQLRKRSISELSLVMDVLRGSPSPSGSQYIHPERASQSTGNLQGSPTTGRKSRRRRRVQKTWQAISPSHFQKQMQIGNQFRDSIAGCEKENSKTKTTFFFFLFLAYFKIDLV